MKPFRIASVILPTLVALVILFTYAWLCESTEPTSRLFVNTPTFTLLRINLLVYTPLICSHSIPGILLTSGLLALSARMPLLTLRFQFVLSIIALAISVGIINHHVWSPRLVGGWDIALNIYPLLHTVPIAGSIAALLGLALGYLICSGWLRLTQ